MIRKIYVYLVLFATLMMTIGGSISVFVSLTHLIAPDTYVMSYEDYVQSYHTESDEKGNGKHSTKTLKDQYKTDYADYIQQEEDSEKKRNLHRFIASFGWIIIPLPVFLWMQRKLHTEEKEDGK